MTIALWFLSENALQAQDEGAVRIGVIDMQRVLRESVAVSNLSQTVEQRRGDLRTAQRKKEAEIRRADQALARERSNLDPDAYTQRRQELQSRATAEQRNFQSEKKDLDRLFRQGMAQIQQTLVQAAQEIAAERRLDIVLDKATVVLVRPEFEITDDAIALLNSRMPEVELVGLEGE
ncbi:MAG: OmpH family outer membrane protein [Pseudomonadota bacterium]